MAKLLCFQAFYSNWVLNLSAGLGQVVFLLGNGLEWAVGRNNNGQVGDGTTTERTYPVRVINSDGSNFTGVKDVSAAGYHTIYLKVNGEVWGAGKIMLFANLFSEAMFPKDSAFQFLGNKSYS
jgi:alpha-tubulin suppressor-like RCC1 family protein